MNKLKEKENLSDYAPIGQSFCEGKCDRKILQTKDGIIIICDGCKRIVIDNRE